MLILRGGLLPDGEATCSKRRSKRPTFDMLSEEKVAEIEQWLSTGLSQRKVALRTGVSRAVIQRITRGKRPKKRAPSPPDVIEPTGEYRRCGGCGGKVMMPCVRCQVVRFRQGAAGSDSRETFSVAADLACRLTPEQESRRLEIRHGLFVSPYGAPPRN